MMQEIKILKPIWFIKILLLWSLSKVPYGGGLCNVQKPLPNVYHSPQRPRHSPKNGQGSY